MLESSVFTPQRAKVRAHGDGSKIIDERDGHRSPAVPWNISAPSTPEPGVKSAVSALKIPQHFRALGTWAAVSAHLSR
jgi:hypothetical protein